MLRAPFQLSETRKVHRFTIQNLPHELLERIFEAVAHLPRTLPVDENYPYRRLFSKLPYCPPDSIAILSQVCIRWRETVLQMPALWSFIHLTRSLESHRRLRANLGRSLDWLPTYLARSRNSPLHITLDTTRLPVDATLSLINPYNMRWVTFTLFVSHVGSLPQIIRSLVRIRIPRLQQLLIISDIYREGIMCYGHLAPFFVTGTPSLATVCLTGVYVAWGALPFTNLQNLELRFTSRWPSFVKLQNMFAASPRLKRLIIHDDIAAILRHVGRPLDEPTVELARLKHFEIEVFHNRNETADVVGLLDLFNLPALQILVIKSVKLNEWMAITDKYNLPVDAFPARGDGATEKRNQRPVRAGWVPRSFPYLSVLTVTSVPPIASSGSSRLE